VEEVNLGEFDSEMLEENIFCAGPLVSGRRDLGLSACLASVFLKGERLEVHLGVSSDGSRELHQWRSKGEICQSTRFHAE